jgi:hypothetical protein
VPVIVKSEVYVSNVKRGILVGLSFTAAYSVYVVILYLLSGNEPFEVHHTTLLKVVRAYVFGGVVAGATVGLLQPFVRGKLTAVSVGVVAAFFISIGLGVATSGMVSQWGSQQWITVTIMALLFGSYGGLYFWKTPAIARTHPLRRRLYHRHENARQLHGVAANANQPTRI